jgi:hypothetical protein
MLTPPDAERKRPTIWVLCLDPLNLAGANMRELNEDLHVRRAI